MTRGCLCCEASQWGERPWSLCAELFSVDSHSFTGSGSSYISSALLLIYHLNKPTCNNLAATKPWKLSADSRVWDVSTFISSWRYAKRWNQTDWCCTETLSADKMFMLIVSSALCWYIFNCVMKSLTTDFSPLMTRVKESRWHRRFWLQNNNSLCCGNIFCFLLQNSYFASFERHLCPSQSRSFTSPKKSTCTRGSVWLEVMKIAFDYKINPCRVKAVKCARLPASCPQGHLGSL